MSRWRLREGWACGALQGEEQEAQGARAGGRGAGGRRAQPQPRAGAAAPPQAAQAETRAAQGHGGLGDQRGPAQVYNIIYL